MTMDPKNRSVNGTRERQADRWTRESFTFRRMSWGDIWLLLAALVLLAFAIATWMTS
jgi:hypothetical protein